MGGPAGILASNLLHLLPYLCICINIFICNCMELHCIDLYQYLYLYLFAFLCPFHKGGFVRVSSLQYTKFSKIQCTVLAINCFARCTVQYFYILSRGALFGCFRSSSVYSIHFVRHCVSLQCVSECCALRSEEWLCQWTVLGVRDKGRVMGSQWQAGQDSPILPTIATTYHYRNTRMSP